jgi:hypothetical protein
MSLEILISVLGGAAIATTLVEGVLIFRLAKTQTQLVEQALIFLSSKNTSEATNAISTLEYNRAMMKPVKAEKVKPQSPAEPTIIKDKVSGREYEILSGEIDA